MLAVVMFVNAIIVFNFQVFLALNDFSKFYFLLGPLEEFGAII